MNSGRLSSFRTKIFVTYIISILLRGHNASLKFCHSVTSLDLSSNNISGSIPPALCDWLPFLVSLDLSSNALSGHIPSELANCRYLNSLNLAFNNLSGSIPSSLVRLGRLKSFDLSYNNLSGPIPGPLYYSYPSSFNGNPLFFQHYKPLSVSLTKFIFTNLIAGAFGFACSFLLLFYSFHRSNKEREQTVTLFEEPLVPLTVRSLLSAVGNFNPDLIISAGNALNLTTYKAILTDGSELAIKRIRSCPLDDETFNCEMDLLSKLRHPNLVSLLGFCANGTEKLLVYKHMPGGSLFDLIHADPSMLDWPARLNISIGVAHGVGWLHHGLRIPFVHENISSQSILLDDDLEPRLTDYCLAEISAPEYVGDYSTKSDVYDFGLLMLELFTGKNPTDTIDEVGSETCLNLDLVDWINRLEKEGRIIDAVDSSLRGKGYDQEILQYHKVALGCLADLPEERSSMDSVCKSLRKIGGLRHCTKYFDDFPLLFRLN
jgi:Protein tyrosine and serine/threonine kinase/Leucine Rich repeat